MRVEITLCTADGDWKLFEGSTEQCPPIPRPGDLVHYDSTSARVEGVQYRYMEAHVEIQLYA